MFCKCFAHSQVRFTGHKGDRSVNIEAEIGKESGCIFLHVNAGDGTVSIEREMVKERGNRVLRLSAGGGSGRHDITHV